MDNRWILGQEVYVWMEIWMDDDGWQNSEWMDRWMEKEQAVAY